MFEKIRLYLSTAMVLAVILFIFQSCSSDKKEQPNIDTKLNIEPPATATERDSIFYGFTAEDSTTVFELTTNNYIVEYDKSGDDFFVFSINSVDQGNDYFWIYAVNDTMGNMASNKRRVGPGDRVVWHFRLITR